MTFKGHSYGVGVRLSSTNKVLLAVENFEDVEPEGMLRQACEAEAGCPGYIETSSGMYWPSSSPLERKGWYYFTPRPTLQGGSIVVVRLVMCPEGKEGIPVAATSGRLLRGSGSCGNAVRYFDCWASERWR